MHCLSRRSPAPLALALALAACGGDPPPAPREPAPEPTDSGDPGPAPSFTEVAVRVTLDGQAAAGVEVRQGGGDTVVLTDATGLALLPLDPAVEGDQVALAAHPEARVRAALVDGPEVEIALLRFDPSDNPDYRFQDPGTPDDRGDTSKCAHCHQTLAADWAESPHRYAASNPRVHDLYAGTASYLDAASCAQAGGRWWTGLEPGTGAPLDRCYLGRGVLPDLDPSCGQTAPCDGVATRFGACADCHAPGIDGVLGGRDLLEATGHAYAYGVHCDVCHKVESVDLSAPAGVAGRLHLVRPSEPDAVFDWMPLSFGPLGDVPNPRMGASAARSHFRDTGLCAGCHELDQAALIPGESVDPVRWPLGAVPVHSTWSEWFAGPMNPGSPCQACHMPPDPLAGNAADLFNIVEPMMGIGISTGWPRPAGTVRRHLWVGPRATEGADLLALAAAVDLVPRWEGSEWVIEATVRNVGAGHGIPTGEPMRQVLLVVEADCGGVPLTPTGGDVLPDYAGAYDAQDATGDWTRWPGAQVGDRIRVVDRPGGFRDYVGHGPFGDGRFDAAAKGVPVELWAGERTVIDVVGEVVTLDGPLPAGAVAYRLPPAILPADGDPIAPLAGAPGYGFARVLVDAAGNRMVPHHAAVDLVSDQRLLPQQAWTSTHRFDGAACANPTARAVLVHRAFPWALAAERGWLLTESVMVEVGP